MSKLEEEELKEKWKRYLEIPDLENGFDPEKAEIR